LTPASRLRLAPDLETKAREVAADLLGEPALAALAVDRERLGRAGAPAMPRGRGVHLEDLSSIPLVSELSGASGFQLRARLRAASGDVVLATRQPPTHYEEYNASGLGLGGAHWLVAGGGELAVARAAWRDRTCFAELTRLARLGPIYLHPYIAAEEVWELADRLRRSAGCPVPVLGPPPPLCAFANDKIHFSALVGRMLGPEALVDQRASSDLRELATQALSFAARYPRLVLKRPCCSSALGNRVIDSRELHGLEAEDLIPRLARLLREMGWVEGEPALVMRWEEKVLLSPSVQLWIEPAAGVFCEGIFCQRFAADRQGRFEAAVPASLAGPVESRLRTGSVALATVLRYLGYAGRCSFDALLVGERQETAAIRYVDCNGRWGAVSTPMTLLNRLFGDHRRLAYVISDCLASGLVGAGFPELLRLLGPALVQVRRGRLAGRLLVCNAGPLSDCGKLSVVCLGASQPDAEELLTSDLPRLLSGGGRPGAAGGGAGRDREP
jgi:hypothetical protein